MIADTHASHQHPPRRRRDAEARRQDILDVAADVFLEQGYEAGAMSEVARRLGGSKGTLYRYFASKQALFAAVVQEGAARHCRDVLNSLSETGDLALDLARLGRALLTFVASDEHIALCRAVIAEAGRSDLGRLYFDQACRMREPVAARLARAMLQGRFRPADPWIAAAHFRSLCLSDLYDMRLKGVIEAPSPQEITRAADEAVELFLRAYEVRRPSR